jgi:hypothetical protein
MQQKNYMIGQVVPELSRKISVSINHNGEAIKNI